MAIIKVKTGGITADAITDALIADDVVGTEHLTANEVDTTALGADAVTAAKIADDAVSDEHLDVTSITGQTAETSVADGDTLLIHDASASALRKMTVANLTANAGTAGLSSSSGNITITDGNLILASGHGIDFSATSDSSGMQAELLNDYEEGTFTPSYTVAGGSLTAGGQGGEYVKIGNLVHVQIALSTNGISSPSGDVEITGLPFTTGDNTSSGLSLGILYRWNTDFDGDLIFRIPQDGVIVNIWKNASNASGVSRMQGSDFLDGSAKNQLVLNGCYSVR